MKEKEFNGKKIASLTKRAISMMIDDFLVSFIVFVAFYDTFKNAKTLEEMEMIASEYFLYIFIAYTLYHWVFVSLYGKTVGKFLMKISVIDMETFQKPDHLKSFIRSLFRNFDEMFLYAGMAVAVFDPLNRTLHDMVGRCVVVED